MFRELSTNYTLINLGRDVDSLYQNFYNFCEEGNIGKFQKVDHYVVESLVADTTAAIITNNNIPTRCTMEENQRKVNTVYLQQITYEQDTANTMGLRYEFSETEVALLEGAAYQNGEIGGEAIKLLDISTQAPGVYYVKIENETGLLKVEKIIKE